MKNINSLSNSFISLLSLHFLLLLSISFLLKSQSVTNWYQSLLKIQLHIILGKQKKPTVMAEGARLNTLHEQVQGLQN